jgi:ABC-type lipoprotein release transport system permease subunit
MNTNEIEYTEVNDEEIYMKIADDNKIMSMPFAEIDGIIYKTKDLQAYILDITKGEK